MSRLPTIITVGRPLEEALLEFAGALVLVTHDRYLLDRVSNIVLGLDGRGNAELFADYMQWEAWRADGGGAASFASGQCAMVQSCCDGAG